MAKIESAQIQLEVAPYIAYQIQDQRTLFGLLIIILVNSFKNNNKIVKNNYINSSALAVIDKRFGRVHSQLKKVWIYIYTAFISVHF